MIINYIHSNNKFINRVVTVGDLFSGQIFCFENVEGILMNLVKERLLLKNLNHRF